MELKIDADLKHKTLSLLLSHKSYECISKLKVY